LNIPALIHELRDAHRQELETATQLPAHATYHFDRERPADQAAAGSLPVRKTMRRTVVSLRFCRFESREVVRQETGTQRTVVHRSPQLAAVVPKGGRYAYDLIAHVGVQTFLRGRTLQDVARELSEGQPSLKIAFSSLYEVQRKFLFYLGHLHHQAAPRLKDYLQQRGNVTWLIDGTLEPGTPVFFGVKEADEGLFLDSWKISTENVDDIVQCLTQARQRYGSPHRVLHDLSEVMSSACDQALPHVRHFICHYHLLSDIGADLYAAPQAALSKRLRALKLQPRLKEQRRGQTKWLREKIRKPEHSLVLMDLLDGKPVSLQMTDLLGREVLLALHLWIMDYANDGHRQGFPFDPYSLYFHRRVVQADAAFDRLFRQPAVRQQAPKVLTSCSDMLKQYLTDPQIVEAAGQYEKAWRIFQDLRAALRLSSQSDNPLHDRYLLHEGEAGEIQQSINQLREDYRQRCDRDSDEVQHSYQIVLTHLDKYWSYLLPSAEHAEQNGSPSCYQRTTNGLEGHWGESKRGRRKVHGRRKITRDMHALPPEYMLIPNLGNSRYVELVLGSLDRLPDKLAEAGQTAGLFSHWHRQLQPLHLGRLPRRLLRQENFIDHLVGTYDDQCQPFLEQS